MVGSQNKNIVRIFIFFRRYIISMTTQNFFSRCTFSNNGADNSSGGVIDIGSESTNVVLSQCTIANQTVDIPIINCINT